MFFELEMIRAIARMSARPAGRSTRSARCRVLDRGSGGHRPARGPGHRRGEHHRGQGAGQSQFDLNGRLSVGDHAPAGRGLTPGRILAR